MPTTDISLSDKSTVTTLLAVIAGLVGMFHPGFSLAPFIPAVSAAVTGLAPLVLVASKHHYSKGSLESAANATLPVVRTVESALPPNVETRLQSLEAVIYKLSGALQSRG